MYYQPGSPLPTRDTSFLPNLSVSTPRSRFIPSRVLFHNLMPVSCDSRSEPPHPCIISSRVNFWSHHSTFSIASSLSHHPCSLALHIPPPSPLSPSSYSSDAFCNVSLFISAHNDQLHAYNIIPSSFRQITIVNLSTYNKLSNQIFTLLYSFAPRIP